MKKIIKTMFLMLGIWIFFSIYTVANAATATISANKQTATVGDTVTITTTIKAASWTLTVSGNGVTQTGYADVTDDANNATITKSLNLDTSKAGTYTIYLKGDVTDGDTGATTTISTSTTVTINEKPAPTPTPTPIPTPVPTPTPTPVPKSGDATLKYIKVGDKEYRGSALNGIISQTVESSVSSISISADVNNKKANYSGTGTKSLKAGQTNSFNITVTAENGTKKTYKVNVIRKAIENQEPNIIEDNKQEKTEQEKLKLTSLIIKDVELNTEFSPDVLNYVANVSNMEELEIDATANKEGAEIKIEGASELKEGDNKITITVILGEEKAEYIIDLYNKIEKQEEEGLKIDTQIEIIKDVSTIDKIKDYIIENWKLLALLLIILILAIIAIICAILAYKYKKAIKELTGEDEFYRKEAENNKEEEVLEQKEKNNKKGKHF